MTNICSNERTLIDDLNEGHIASQQLEFVNHITPIVVRHAQEIFQTGYRAGLLAERARHAHETKAPPASHREVRGLLAGYTPDERTNQGDSGCIMPGDSPEKSNCDRRQEGIVALSDEIEKQLSVPPGPSPSSRPEPTTTGSPGGTEPQCSKCKTLLAFEGDECWACSKEER